MRPIISGAGQDGGQPVERLQNTKQGAERVRLIDVDSVEYERRIAKYV